jgi:transcriptional regulator with XRE-family HTH domain
MEEFSEPSITPGQLRAGRALLRFTQDDLAGMSGVSKAAIARIELADQQQVATARLAQDRTLRDLRGALEDAGVIFLPSDTQGGPGVRVISPDLRITALHARTGLEPFYGVMLEGFYRGTPISVTVPGLILDALDRQPPRAADAVPPNVRRAARALHQSFRRHQHRLLPLILFALAARRSADGELNLKVEHFQALFPAVPGPVRA